MNRKADYLIKDNLIYLVLLIIFLMPVAVFVWSQMDGAIRWADFYAKEGARIIDLSQPGDEVTFDVHKATVIALNNEIKFNEIFSFDNVENEFCVKLTRGKKSCYHYFNDVDVVDWRLEPGYGEPPVNTLRFRIQEATKA